MMTFQHFPPPGCPSHLKHASNVLFFAFEPTGVWHGEGTSAEFGRQRDLVWYEGLVAPVEFLQGRGEGLSGKYLLFKICFFWKTP